MSNLAEFKMESNTREDLGRAYALSAMGRCQICGAYEVCSIEEQGESRKAKIKPSSSSVPFALALSPSERLCLTCQWKASVQIAGLERRPS